MPTLHVFVLVTTAAIVATIRRGLDNALMGCERASAVGVKDIQYKSVRGCKDRMGCRRFFTWNRWKTQDRALALRKEGLTLLAVFDGHGDGGEDVSEALRSRFELLFQAALPSAEEKWFKTEIGKALTEVDEKTKRGGSTAVIAVVLSDRVLVANVGDSRALLLTAGNGSVPTATPLSIDQTPCFEGKKQVEDRRIAELPQCTYYANRTPLDPSCTEASPLDIIRMWNEDVGCGARFTRSVGDPSCGECAPPTPVFLEHNFIPTDEYLILASDGLTEYLKNDVIGRLVWSVKGKKKKTKQMLTKLLDASRTIWMKRNGNAYVDDTTIILVRLG